MGRLLSCLAVCLCCVLASCGSAETEAKRKTKTQVGEDHVWKSQVQAIDRAREVDGMLRDSSKRQQQPTE